MYRHWICCVVANCDCMDNVSQPRYSTTFIVDNKKRGCSHQIYWIYLHPFPLTSSSCLLFIMGFCFTHVVQDELISYIHPPTTTTNTMKVVEMFRVWNYSHTHLSPVRVMYLIPFTQLRGSFQIDCTSHGHSSWVKQNPIINNKQLDEVNGKGCK
jgi:hypothetical protein